MSADLQKENEFNVTFYDADTGRLVEDVRYDFIVSDSSGHALTTRTNLHDPVQKVVFPGQGSYSLDISNIENLGESMLVPIQVSPEFPSVSSFLAPALIAGFISVRLATIYLERSSQTR